LKRWTTKGLVLLSFLLAPAAKLAAESATETTYATDSRFQRIRAFFQRRNCPASQYAAEFLKAADSHQLDWRLLPSIALVESGGGKVSRNNNIFGWNSARGRFPSIQAGIHTVAERLANCPYTEARQLTRS
jgi:hypothetical protein